MGGNDQLLKGVFDEGAMKGDLILTGTDQRTALFKVAKADGTVSMQAGGGTGLMVAQGQLNVQLGSQGNGADTTEDTLYTFSLPASSLSRTGQGVRVRARGTFAANGDNKTVRLYFGSSVVLSSGTLTSNNLAWESELWVAKNGASTQLASGEFLVPGADDIQLNGAGTETDTGAITIKLTGQAGSANANDIVCNMFSVEFLNY